MAPCILDLPDELLVEILQYLPKLDLKTARLSCSRLGATGAPLLFHRVYFAPRKFDIERFRNIAQHPVFSKSIKELVYDGRLFCEEYGEAKAYKAMLFRQSLSPHSTALNPEGVRGQCLEGGLEQYSSCIEEQVHILDNKADYHTLVAGLGQMPIRRLTIQDRFRDYDHLPIHATDHSWYHETCRLRFPNFLPSSWDEFRLPLKWDDHAPDVLTWDCRGLAHLFHAISKQCYMIDELHIGTQHSMAPMLLFQSSSGIIDHIDRLAPRLTCLKLDFESCESDQGQDVDATASRLADLMQNAKGLRVLSSSMFIDEQHSRQIFQGWRASPHLSLLDLGHLRTTQYSLAAIIEAQKDTLSELKLRYMYMMGPGSWKGLGDEIGQSLKLQKVTLSELFSASPPIPLSSCRGREIAYSMMRWASPETLEICHSPSGHPFTLVASLKHKGKILLYHQ